MVQIAAPIGKRWREERERLGFTQDRYVNVAEVSLRTLKAWEADDGPAPDADALARVARVGADVLYIITGKRSDEPQKGRANELHQQRAGYVYLPLYDVRAAAGKGRVIDDNELVKDVLAFREDWIRNEVHARPEDIGLCFVDGNSNVPDMHPGDIVMFNRADTKISRDSYYLIRMAEALLIKRLQHLPGGIIKVSSKNAEYEPFTIKVADIDGPDSFNVLGRVVWRCSRL